MSVMGAPDFSGGVHITPMMGANGELIGMHVGAGPGSPSRLRQAASLLGDAASDAARDAAAATGRGASWLGRKGKAGLQYAGSKAWSAADKAEMKTCMRVSDALFDEVARQRGYVKPTAPAPAE
jgi:hypothetical protein